LVVNGEPTGKGRPRSTRTGHHYTPDKTVSAEQRIQGEWIAAGRPRMDDGPLLLLVECVLARPQGHWLKSGGLSAAGHRSSWPTKRPDVDNVVKLVMDALNGQAYRDDAQVAALQLWRRWANAQEQPHTRIDIRPLS